MYSTLKFHFQKRPVDNTKKKKKYVFVLEKVRKQDNHLESHHLETTIHKIVM